MIIGVDPGIKGGAALLSLNGEILQVYSFVGKSEQDIAGHLNIWCGIAKACVLEKVTTMPRDGRVGAFTFGRVYGFLRGILQSNALCILDVTPAVWQSRMSCLSGGDKNVTKQAAQKLFPGIKMTHYIADAVLIAEYGRRLYIVNPAAFNASTRIP